MVERAFCRHHEPWRPAELTSKERLDGSDLYLDEKTLQSIKGLKSQRHRVARKRVNFAMAILMFYI